LRFAEHQRSKDWKPQAGETVGVYLFYAARSEPGLPCVSGDELVSLGFRVGNSSAIGWHQRANFPASLLPVGVTPTTSRRNRDARFAPKNGPEAQAER